MYTLLGLQVPSVPQPVLLATNTFRSTHSKSTGSLHASSTSRSSPTAQQQHYRQWHICSAADLWTPNTEEALNSAAQKLRSLVDALPELPDEVQGAIAMRVPGALDIAPQEVRARLEGLSSAMGIDFVTTAKLVGKVRALFMTCWHVAGVQLSAKLYVQAAQKQKQPPGLTGNFNTHKQTAPFMAYDSCLHHYALTC